MAFYAGIYDPDFVAANQEERADNLIKGTKSEQLAVVRQQIRAFKEANQVDKIVVLWTANTERFAQVCDRQSEQLEGAGAGFWGLGVAGGRGSVHLPMVTAGASSPAAHRFPFLTSEPTTSHCTGGGGPERHRGQPAGVH